MEPLAIIQARMGATRLPGKVLLDLCGKTVLHHVIDRVRSCTKVARTVIATTLNGEDDAVEQEAKDLEVDCYRGDESDVLDRYYQAASKFSGDPIVRITADCPLLDPDLLTLMLEKFEQIQNSEKLDYLSNTQTRTIPRGLDIEIFNRASLTAAWQEARKPEEREHVTPFIYRNPDRFTLHDFSGDIDLSHLRWTLDTQEDLNLIREIYKALYNKNNATIFTTDEVLALLEQKPGLQTLNAHIQQKTH